jgi:hypothetical protein
MSGSPTAAWRHHAPDDIERAWDEYQEAYNGQ